MTQGSQGLISTAVKLKTDKKESGGEKGHDDVLIG